MLQNCMVLHANRIRKESIGGSYNFQSYFNAMTYSISVFNYLLNTILVIKLFAKKLFRFQNMTIFHLYHRRAYYQIVANAEANATNGANVGPDICVHTTDVLKVDVNELLIKVNDIYFKLTLLMILFLLIVQLTP